MADDPEESRLHGFDGGILVTGSDDQQVAPQTIVVVFIKRPVSRLIARFHPAGERGYIEPFSRVHR